MKLNKKICLLGVAMVIMIALGAWINLQRGIALGDKFLVQKSSEYFKSGNDEIHMIKSDEVTKFQMTIDGEEKEAELIWDENMSELDFDYARITFQDGSVVEGYWNNEDMLINEEGTPLVLLNDHAIMITVNGETVPIPNDVLANVLCQLDLNNVQQRGSIIIILFAVFIYVCGALTFLYPDEMAFFLSRWRYYNPELSDVGRWTEQAGGVACMIMSFIVVCMPIWLE